MAEADENDEDFRYYAAGENPARWLVRRFVTELAPFIEGGAPPDLEDSTFEALKEGVSAFTESAWSERDRFVRDSRRDLSQFEQDLRRHWDGPLTALLYFIQQCISAGNNALIRHNGLGRSGDALVNALRHLHGRGCRVAWEIQTLLANGFADGADARWRTLHEISVTASFIRLKGPECAERFLAHDVVTTVRDAVTRAQVFGGEPPTHEAFVRLVATRDELVGRFGRVFAKRYGWAAADLPGRGDPTFEKIERAAGMGLWHYAYSSSSKPVHADSRNLLSEFHVRHGMDTSLAGPSANGLATPAIMTVRSLFHLTTALLGLYPRPWAVQDDEVRTAMALDQIARKVLDEWLPAEDETASSDHEGETTLPNAGPDGSDANHPSLESKPEAGSSIVGPQRDGDNESTSGEADRSGSYVSIVIPTGATSDPASRGYALLQQGLDDNALAAFDEAIRASPDDAAAWDGRALALLRTGRFDDALASSEKAGRLSPDDVVSLTNMSVVLGMVGRPEEGVQVAERALGVEPASVEAAANRANNLRLLGRLDDALSAYERLVTHAPTSPQILHGLAATFRALGREEEALACLTRELQLQPPIPVHSLMDRAAVLRRLGRLALAHADLDSACRLAPGDPRPLLDRARVRSEEGDKVGAIEDHRAAVPLAGDDPRLLNELSVGLSDLGRVTEALEVIDRALALRPEYSIAHVNRGVCLSRLGHLEDAEPEFRQAIVCDPSNPNAHVNLAITRLNAGDGLAAIESAQRAADLDPSLASSHSVLGAALLATGRDTEAASVLRKATELAPTEWRAAYDLAIAEARCDHAASALASLRRAVEASPEARSSARKDRDFDVLRSDPALRSRLDALLGRAGMRQSPAKKRDKHRRRS